MCTLKCRFERKVERLALELSLVSCVEPDLDEDRGPNENTLSDLFDELVELLLLLVPKPEPTMPDK